MRYGDPSIGNAEYHRIYIDERGRPIYEANVSASYFTGRMLSITKNDPKGKWQLPIDYLKGKVIAIQGIGGTGGQLLQPLLEAGAIVIASDVDLPTIESVNTEYTSDINSNKLFIFQEEKLPGGGYTNKIMNPLEAFPEKLKGMGVTNIDVFSPCAIGPVVNPETVKKLKAAGVKIICGACNNVTEDKKRDPELLKQAGIAYIPDYIANAGGVTGVDGHLGHNVTDMGISKRIFNRVEDILLTSSIRNKPPQVVADETSRKFFEALKQVRLSGYQLTFGEKFSNRMYPKEGLNDLTFDDGSKVRVLTAKEDYPEEVLEHWDKHYAVFEITNEELGYTAYMAIHRLTKIESESRRVNGQYRATGGTRILKYKSNNAALADALELSQEMSFKNAGAGLAIGGSKCTINVKIDPRSNGKDAMARRQVLISYAKAIEKIGNLIGGGVLTGQDVNISVTDAKLFFEHAPTSIVPYIAPHLCIAPTRPTGIGVFAAMVAALKNTSEPLSYAVKLRDMFDVRFVNTTSL